MTYTSIDPVTEQTLASYPEHGDAQLDKLLATANSAFQEFVSKKLVFTAPAHRDAPA